MVPKWDIAEVGELKTKPVQGNRMSYLYKHVELQETISSTHKVWKGCHLATYVLAIVSGVLNFYFFYTLIRIFGDHCVLHPHRLEFTKNSTNVTYSLLDIANITNGSANVTNFMLDLKRSNFQTEDKCNLALYVPVLSVIFALIWSSMFLMCPAGGLSKVGLPKPWRILTPALVFALIFLCIAAWSFNDTNSGLADLCSNFTEVTFTSRCTSIMDEHIFPAVNETLPSSTLIMSTRLTSALVLASWVACSILIIARCIAAPDFHIANVFVRLRDTESEIQEPSGSCNSPTQVLPSIPESETIDSSDSSGEFHTADEAPKDIRDQHG